MGFQELNGLDADTTISLGGTNRKTGKKNPTEIEGYYLGKREIADPKKKSGKSYIYIFQTPKGNVGVWGKTDMDKRMLAAEPGVMIRVTFTGMKSVPNGEMYAYKVEADADNTIEVGGGNSHTGSSFESVEEDDGGDESLDEVADDAQYAMAASKARTNALLGGKGKKVQ